MALEREARTNFMGPEIDKRNRNWEKLDGAVIVESGSNERGRYVKYGDGTLTMTGTATLTLRSVGSASLSAGFVFPISCADTSYGISVQLTTLLSGAKRGGIVVVITQNPTGAMINYSLSAGNILESGDTVDVSVTINGTWK